MRIALIIPTRNASAWLDNLIPAVKSQTLQPDKWLVVDSASTDNTAVELRNAGAQVYIIDAKEFNHGGTRRWASEQVEADILIFMTQDAIPHPNCFAELCAAFQNPRVAVAYARQLPRKNAGILESHARLFNYPAQPRTKSLEDKAQLGIKTCFSSDSCAAYRVSALNSIGGFPQDVIGSEDAFVAGKALIENWSVHYAAQALVEHSHDYSLLEEFKRYFDIGVFYGREHWITTTFGHASGEGLRFVKSEIRALLAVGQWYRIPEVLLRSALKISGYKLGKKEHYIPTPIKRSISMFSGYWVEK